MVRSTAHQKGPLRGYILIFAFAIFIRTVRRVSPLHCVWEDLLVPFSVYYVVVVVSYCFQVRDAGNLLTRAGFSLPGVDVDDYVVKYKSALDLIDHLRAMGETNALLHRTRHILNRETALATAAIYDSMFATEDGTIPATFQVIYMTGWREHSSHPQAKRRGSATVSFTDIQKQFGAYS
ncbi:hypothetical protein F2Q69_00054532 [Brassica cretica]|uniref:Uncharacterized protein n=1 Tax=Brassica cretica TaxID=69181 RepID=A0A8S9N418_BRACR|nr:hypothetical protein F2Q69_00054532 [Brassica cretica]